jgi:hypothetical protein
MSVQTIPVRICQYGNLQRQVCGLGTRVSQDRAGTDHCTHERERELRFTEHAEVVVQDLINAGYAGRLRTKLNAVLIRVVNAIGDFLIWLTDLADDEL